MDALQGHIEPAGPELIAELWQGFTGLPIVTVDQTYDRPEQVEALVWRDANGEAQGHISWAVDGQTAEIVTLQALVQGARIGGRLLDAAEAELRRRGIGRIVVTTTNDNLRAQAFYIRRGYRLARIERDGMERVRALKPDVPLNGHEGLPLLDMWEFEKIL